MRIFRGIVNSLVFEKALTSCAAKKVKLLLIIFQTGNGDPPERNRVTFFSVVQCIIIK